MAPSKEEGRLSLARVLLSLAAAISYFVSFGNVNWLKDAEGNAWGPWQFCNNTNATPVCEGISPGDSPGYYEAHRCFAAFALVGYIITFFVCNPKEGVGRGQRPALISTCLVIEVFISLTALAVGVKDVSADDDFFNASVELGWCFHLAATAGGMTLLTIPILLRLAILHKRKPAAKEVPAAKPTASTAPKPKPGPKSKPKPAEANNQVVPAEMKAAESITKASTPTTTTTTTHQPEPEPKSTTRPVSAGGDEKPNTVVLAPLALPEPGNPKAATDAGKGSSKLPDLSIRPRYRIMPDIREGDPEAPPPEYHDVIGDDAEGCEPPPQPVEVRSSRFAAVARYVRDYAKVAVGLGEK